METVFSTIVAKAVQLSTADAGAIYVFSKLRQKFRLRATYGMSEAMIVSLGEAQMSAWAGRSYIGAASDSGAPVRVPDLQSEPVSAIGDVVLRIEDIAL